MRPSLHPAVAAARAYLEDAPEHPWRLPELANRVGLDPDYFGRLFRRDTGQSPIDYLARVRVERAAHLLTRSKLPVSRVGARVGWGRSDIFRKAIPATDRHYPNRLPS